MSRASESNHRVKGRCRRSLASVLFCTRPGERVKATQVSWGRPAVEEDGGGGKIELIAGETLVVVSGSLTLRCNAHKWLTVNEFWSKSLIRRRFHRVGYSSLLLPIRLESTGLVETIWRRPDVGLVRRNWVQMALPTSSGPPAASVD